MYSYHFNKLYQVHSIQQALQYCTLAILTAGIKPTTFCALPPEHFLLWFSKEVFSTPSPSTHFGTWSKRVISA